VIRIVFASRDATSVLWRLSKPRALASANVIGPAQRAQDTSLAPGEDRGFEHARPAHQRKGDRRFFTYGGLALDSNPALSANLKALLSAWIGRHSVKALDGLRRAERYESVAMKDLAGGTPLAHGVLA